MSLDAVALSAQLGFTLSRAIDGFQPQSHSDAKSYRLAPDVGTYSLLQAKRYTVAGGASQPIDLYGFYDLYGDIKVMTGAIILFILPTVTGGGCKIEPGDSNPLTWFLSGTSPGVIVPSGGLLVFAQPSPQVIDATHRILKLTNTHGSNPMTVDVLVVGKP